MKKIEVKVRYLFEGTYTVAADDRNEARTMVTRDCGLVLGGDIHTTLDDDEVDWEFDVHPDMQILSYTELEKKQKPKRLKMDFSDRIETLRKDIIDAIRQLLYSHGLTEITVHQALALCNDFDSKRISLDTLIRINKGKLDPNTWSPMLKEHSEPEFSLPIRKLLNYTLIQSDNNVSNLMFKRLLDIAKTDSFVATIIPRSSFQIAYTEEEMSADHDKAYSNYTSPLGAAMLMNRLFTDKIISDEKQDFIKNTLKECKTGTDRIAAPLLDKEGVVIAHKTGSGYINENGILAAHNDVAFIRLPNNEYYTLAVFVKDFKGNETQAAKVIARISETVYSLLPQFTE